MRPLEVTIKGYATYGHAHVDLSGDQLLGIGGRNGRGKSHLLDSMRFCLYGGTRCSSTAELIRWGCTEVYASLVFRASGEVYRVTRQRSVKDKTTLQFDRQVDGQWQSITAGTILKTEDLIRQITGLNDALFCTTSYIGQKDSDRFTRLSSAKRKEMLVETLQLGILSAMGEQARAQANKLRPQADAHRVRLEQLERLPQEIETTDSHLADLRWRKAEAQSAAERRQEELIQAEASVKAREQQEKRAAEIRKQISTCDEERITALEEAEDRHLATRRRRERELRTTNEQTDKAVVSRGLEARRAVDQAEARHLELSDAVRRLEDDLSRTPLAEPELVAKLSRELEELEQKRVSADALHQELQRVSREAEAATNRRERERDLVAGELERDRKSASRLNDEVGCIDLPRARCAYLGDAQAAASRIPDLEQRLAGLQGATPEEAGLHSAAAILRDQIRDLKFTHQDLQQARKDLETYRQRETRAERRPAIQQQLDKALADLQKVDAELPALQAAREELRQELLDLRDAQTKTLSSELATIDQQAVEERERIDKAASARRRDLVAELDQVLPQGQQASDSLLGNARDLARESWAKVQTLDQEIGGAQARLARLKEEEAELEPARALVGQLAREQGHYETLARIFHPKAGAQNELIRQAVPELEARANLLLGLITGGEMQLALIQERENRTTDGVQQVLDVEIYVHGHKLSYEACSGAQQFRVDFSLRLALSYLLAARAGASLEMLAIDEGFGAQDPDGRDLLLDALEVVRRDFDLILVVSHQDDVLGRLPSRLEVYSDAPGEGSKIRRVA